MIIVKDFESLELPEKSSSDEKLYRLIKLPNGLKALLVHQSIKSKSDIKETSSAVCVCIDVGSFEDPFEVQGLSHFLDHMVFMGSEKYPKENDFDQFIKSKSGVDNAMTECEYTTFYFKIGSEHLSGALDRFSNFFIAPLMLPDSMEREMQVVESEFQNDVSNDDFRVNQIFASMARDDSPVGKFTWGNLSTLKIGITSEKLHHIVHEFRRRFYKSNRMCLCIQSSFSLDWQEMLVSKYFSEIRPEYRTIHRFITVDPFVDVFKPVFHKKMFFVKSKCQKRKMILTFLLPSTEKSYKDKSLEYIEYLFNYEGRESLAAYLKKKSLAHQLSARVGARSFEGNSMFTFFTIEVNLTRDGYEDLEAVLDALFAYLFIIKVTPMTEHREIFEEFKQIKETLFRYRNEKSAIENVQELAVNMRYFVDQDIIVGREKCAEFDEIVMKKAIEGINKNQFNLLILSDKFKNYDKIEKWFDTEYAEIDFPIRYTKLWNERWFRTEFSLPWKNRFLCRQFEITSEPAEHDEPLLIFRNNYCKSFFKTDQNFRLPHGLIFVQLRSALTKNSVRNLNMTSIFSMCVKNYLSAKLYSATVAGYSYRLNSVDEGLVLKLSGFNEKLPDIADIVTKALRNTDEVIDKVSFDVFKKELKKNCYRVIINSNMMAEELRLNIVNRNHRFYFDRFKDIDNISYMEFKEFLNFLKSFKIKILIQGNFTKAQALKVTEDIMKNLNQEDCRPEPSIKLEVNQFPLGSSYLRVKSLMPKDKNSVIKNYYQIGSFSTEAESLVELLAKVMREPLFNFVRTKEQLGYSVSCSNKNDEGVLGFTIAVETQEKRHSAWSVDKKIETFLQNFVMFLENMEDKNFEIMKRSIISQKRSPDISLEDEVDRNWTEIKESSFKFDRRNIEALQMELLNKTDLLIFFKEHFAPDKVRKLSVQIIANADDEDDALLRHGFIHLEFLTDDHHNTIKSIAQVKNSLTAFNH